MDSESNTFLVGAAVVALAALATLARNIIAIVRDCRREPPLQEEVAKEYATKRELARSVAELKQELRQERDRVDAALREQYNLIRDLTARISDWMQTVNIMIGKIEGKMEEKK